MNSPLIRYRVSLGIFIVGLVVSGLTTFPLQWEISLLNRMLGLVSASDGGKIDSLRQWIVFVESGVRETHARFPFFFYATDWLGFGHFVIAAFFVLPFADPVKYKAVLYVGLVACAGVLIAAFVCGPLRGIPLGWRLIDSSFGIIGAIPLFYCLYLTRQVSHTLG